MKDPAISVNKAIYDAIGDTIVFDSVTYQFYGTDVPDSPENFYLWGDVIEIEDVGTDDQFIHRVQYEMNAVGNASLQGNQFIIDGIMEQGMSICERGQGLADATGNFKIYTMKVVRQDNVRSTYGDKVEKGRKVVFEMYCGEL